jgi:hypothetical protein
MTIEKDSYKKQRISRWIYIIFVVIVLTPFVFFAFVKLFNTDGSFRSRFQDERLSPELATTSPSLAEFIHSLCRATHSVSLTEDIPSCKFSSPVGDLALVRRDDIAQRSDRNLLYMSLYQGSHFESDPSTKNLPVGIISEGHVADNDPPYRWVDKYPDTAYFWVFADHADHVFLIGESLVGGKAESGDNIAGEKSDLSNEIRFHFLYPLEEASTSRRTSDDIKYKWSRKLYHAWQEDGELYMENYDVGWW